MTHIVFINGSIDHGKDYLALRMKEELERQGFSVSIFKLAEPLKRTAANILGVTEDDIETLKDNYESVKLLTTGNTVYTNVRSLLQKLGDSFKELFGKDIFGKLLVDKITWTEAKIILVPDFRYPEEFDYLNEDLIVSQLNYNSEPIFSLRTIKIYDNSIPLDSSHHSETSLAKFKFNWEVNNTGRPDLTTPVEFLVREVLSGR